MSIKCSSSSCMVVCFFTVMLCLSHCVTLEEIPVCQDVTGFTPQSCCPCFRNELCGVACPGDYLTINPASTVSCEMNSSASTTTSSSQITTTELTMASENTTQLSSAVNVTVCLLSCPVNSYYDNSTKQCLKCDDTCLNCAWPDGKDCTVCKFLYNGTCFSMCPENTVASTNETQDGAKLCETKPPYNGTNQELPIGVIAGGAGGVVVITIIIIILVYCCRRRGRSNTDATEKRAMSVILEQKQSADGNGKEEARKRTDRMHVNYENTSTTLPHPIDIERQGDTIFRYTRDPTFKDTNKKDERNSDDVDYANAAMIRLATNTDLSHVKHSELTDKLEIEEIGIAPSAPVNKPVHTATKRHAPRSVPNSAEQTLPQPVATASKQKKLKRTVNARLTKPPEDYLDMSHGAVAAGPAADADSAPASDLEVYENFSFSEIPQGRRGQKTSTHKKTSPEVGMEVYANTQVDDHGNSEGDNSNLEDYENAKEFRKHSERSNEEANDDLEDYEIMNDLYENYTSPQFQQK